MLAERIKELRQEKKMSQRDLAKTLDVSQQSVTKWERGLFEPNSSTLKQMAQLFNCSSDYLLGLSNDRYELKASERNDIANQAESILKGLNSEATVNFYGEPITDEERIQLRTAIEIGLTSNKKRAKKAKEQDKE